METKSTRLSHGVVAGYAVGDLAHGLAMSTSAFWMLRFLTDELFLAPALAGLALMIGRVWDAITDPLMGWCTDSLSERLGGRRFFLLLGAPLYGLAFFLMWTLVKFESQWATFAYAASVFILFNSIFTMVFVPYSSLTAVMTDDYDERTRLTTARLLVGQVAFLVGIVTPPTLVSFYEASGRTPYLLSWCGLFEEEWLTSSRAVYSEMALLMGLVMFVCLLVVYRYGSHADAVKSDSLQESSPLHYFSRLWKVVKNNQAYQCLVSMMVLGNIAVTCIAVSLPYFLERVMGLNSRTQAGVMGLLFLSGILALPLWKSLSDKTDKAIAFRRAMAVFSVALIILFLTPSSQTWLLYLTAPLAGACYSGTVMLPWAMLPDLVDHLEEQKGERREGLLFGGATFFVKIISGVAVVLVGQLLSVGGYVAGEELSPVAAITVRGLVGVIPCLFVILAARVSYSYPLTRHAA